MVNKYEIEDNVRKMFPIGTKFFPSHLDIKKSNDEFLIVTTHDLEWVGSHLITHTKNGKLYSSDFNLGEGNCGYNRVLYSKGKFATILENINKEEIYELW